jgi:flagellar biosynthesis/type III secretory pathway protein FliH
MTQSSLQAGVHPQTLPLVEQQLQAYDSRQIVWQGQAWPGQELQWRVEEEIAQGGAEATASVWHSRLDLELPQLGKVTALLSLHGGALQIRLSADDARAVSRLDAGRIGLHAALDMAGIALTTMTVESHDA